MDIRELSKGYFNKTYEEKQGICKKILEYYIDGMVMGDSSIYDLLKTFETNKRISIEREEYELTEIFSTIIEAIEEL